MIRSIVIAFGLLGLMAFSVLVYHELFAPKIAYVDIPKVFNMFEMKKEMQEKYNQVEATRKKILDSLSFDLQMLSKKLQSDKENKDLAYMFELKRRDFFNQKSRMEQDNVTLSNQYDKQILERMSQYIMEYGKVNNYDFVYGADGNGMLMYSKDKYDISDKIIAYINNKYKGVE